MASAQLCPYCSFRYSPGDLFCERCKANLLPISAPMPKEKDAAAEPAPVLKPKREHPITEHEALAIVQKELLAEGRRLEDLDLSVTRYEGGSLDAALTPWPNKSGWAVCVLHEWIVRQIIQSGGSTAYVNPETGDTHWVRLP
jgi:hypothetical protein